MSTHPPSIPCLIGCHGLVTDACYPLPHDTEVRVGRSRSCDVSLRRCPAYLAADPDQRDDDEDLNTVSRVHMILRWNDAGVCIWDRSANGTWCNDVPIGEQRQIALADLPIRLRLGNRESFELVALPTEDQRLHQSTPAP